MKLPKHALAKPVALPSITHLLLHDVKLHFTHAAKGPGIPLLHMTYAKQGPNGEPLGMDRASVVVDDKVRAALEAPGNLEDIYLGILVDHLGVGQ